MKNIRIAAVIALLVVPSVTGSVSASAINTDAGYGMMRTIETRALGDELHEEMEDLMVKMMAGTMTEVEAQRMVELMDQYPGAQSMMMSRMMGMNGFGGFGMMPFGGGNSFGSSTWVWVAGLTSFVWLAAGALVVVWLGKQIVKK